jgi:shikimate kinase
MLANQPDVPLTLEHTMILTFIGMSGAGKTFWATKLAAHGFMCFRCDELLATRLCAATGYTGTSLPEIGRWMGLPYESGFRQREALYLACEVDTLRDVIARAAVCAYNGTSCVIDMGGSTIYAGEEIFQQIRSFSTIIYLAIPADVHQQMLTAYLNNPPPLIWNGLFNQEQGESLEQAFMRCYPQLIRHRERLYEMYSDVKLEYSYYRQPALTADSFLRYIQAAAEKARAAKRLDRGDVGIPKL